MKTLLSSRSFRKQTPVKTSHILFNVLKQLVLGLIRWNSLNYCKTSSCVVISNPFLYWKLLSFSGAEIEFIKSKSSTLLIWNVRSPLSIMFEWKTMHLPSKPNPYDFIPQNRRPLVLIISVVLDKYCTVRQVQSWT